MATRRSKQKQRLERRVEPEPFPPVDAARMYALSLVEYLSQLSGIHIVAIPSDSAVGVDFQFDTSLPGFAPKLSIAVIGCKTRCSLTLSGAGIVLPQLVGKVKEAFCSEDETDWSEPFKQDRRSLPLIERSALLHAVRLVSCFLRARMACDECVRASKRIYDEALKTAAAIVDHAEL